MKTTSRFAIVAAASVLAGNAFAADLGGNCCSDLEERVAELEATTARKGNRKVSLTVSGHVNEAVVFWDDGGESNAYIVSNNAARTRFRFVGDAKITGDWSAGYLLEIGARYNNSGSRNQGTDRSGQGNDATRPLDIRHSAWWIDSKQLGRVWVGKTSTATDGITEINLANINSGGSSESYAGGFFLRQAGGGLSGLTWNAVTPSFAGAWWAGEGDRNTTVKWVSPTLHGFTVSTAWGQDDFWDVALRYAGEFNGVRLAAGIGYMQQNDNFGKAAADGPLCADLSGAVATQSAVDCNKLGMSASIMHMPTGLFLTGSYGYIDDKNRRALYGSVAGIKSKDEHWQIQAGIEKNWFGPGKTTLFFDYNQNTVGAGLAGTGQTSATTLADGFAGFLSQAEVNVWGIGVNQAIEAAAMDLYLTYRHHEVDARASLTGSTLNDNKLNFKDFDAVIAGAIIRF